MIVYGAEEAEFVYNNPISGFTSDDVGIFNIIGFSRRIEETTRVRLAQFSVKEYLESSRILASNARDFYLDPAQEHRYLTQSCLVYLMQYSSFPLKSST